MKKILSILLITLSAAAFAQKTVTTTTKRLIAKDSIQLGGVWRSTWPDGTTGIGTAWAIGGNTLGATPGKIGTLDNTNILFYTNNQQILTLEAAAGKAVRAHTIIADNDSSTQVATTAWIQKNIVRRLYFAAPLQVVGDTVKCPSCGSGGGSGWGLSGNAIGASDVFGTTNNRSIKVITNNANVFTIDSLGRLRLRVDNNTDLSNIISVVNSTNARPFDVSVGTGGTQLQMFINSNSSVAAPQYNGLRLLRGNTKDSLVDGIYNSMDFQFYETVKFNTILPQRVSFMAADNQIPLITAKSAIGGRGVYIGSDTTQQASSALTVTANNKGVLIPRLTTTEMNAVASPANGLLIYNTTDTAFYYYKFNAWAKVNASSGGGSSQWTNNTGGIYYLDKVRIGTTDETDEKLYVEGDARVSGNLAVNGDIQTANISVTAAASITNALNVGGDITAPNFIGTSIANVTAIDLSAGDFDITNGGAFVVTASGPGNKIKFPNPSRHVGKTVILINQTGDTFDIDGSFGYNPIDIGVSLTELTGGSTLTCFAIPEGGGLYRWKVISKNIAP